MCVLSFFSFNAPLGLNVQRGALASAGHFISVVGAHYGEGARAVCLYGVSRIVNMRVSGCGWGGWDGGEAAMCCKEDRE